MGTIVLRSQESHKLRHHPQATQGLWGQGPLVVWFFWGVGGGEEFGTGLRTRGWCQKIGWEEWFRGTWGPEGSPEGVDLRVGILGEDLEERPRVKNVGS